MKWVPYVIIAVLLGVILRRCGVSETVRTERTIDTVIVRDTIRDTLIVPRRVYLTRVDTVYLKVAADTVYREVVSSGEDACTDRDMNRPYREGTADAGTGPGGDSAADTVARPVRLTLERKCDYSADAFRPDDYKAALVPIERKEYRTDDYFAVVEGFRTSLVSMEVYPQTKYITRTEVSTVTRRPRFGVGVQAGYGIGPRGPAPYLGVGVQYNIITF